MKNNRKLMEKINLTGYQKVVFKQEMGNENYLVL